jgi:hypothetical protein
MSVSIHGLGPRFRLLINLANEGEDLATNLQVGGVVGLELLRTTESGRCQCSSMLHCAR